MHIYQSVHWEKKKHLFVVRWYEDAHQSSGHVKENVLSDYKDKIN